MIDPVKFHNAFFKWASTVAGEIQGVVVIDGKTARRSEEKSNGKCPLHVISAWVCETSLVLGQMKADEKTNEIKAISYSIYSREGMDAVEYGRNKRSHWGIENSLHWVLDIGFCEDGNRTRTENVAENLNVILRITVYPLLIQLYEKIAFSVICDCF